MAENNKNRGYVTVGIGKEYRDLAQRLVQLKNAIEGTKLSLRAYIELLIELAAAGNFDRAGNIKVEVKYAPVKLRADNYRLRDSR